MFRVPFIRDGLIALNKNNKDKTNSAKPLENMRILEIGCGAGILTEVFSHFKCSVLNFVCLAIQL